MSPIDFAATSLLMVPLAWAVASDSSTFRIPNRIPLIVVGLFVAHALAAWPAIDLAGAVTVGATCLVAGFAVYAFSWFGAGDVKLFAALGLWAGPAYIADLVLITSMTGALMAFSVATPHLVRSGLSSIAGGLVAPCSTPLRDRRLPYGVAIAAGGVYLTTRLISG